MPLQPTSAPELEPDEPAAHDHIDADHDASADGFIVFSLGASFDESLIDAS